MRKDSRETFSSINDCVMCLIALIVLSILGYLRCGLIGGILYISVTILVATIVSGISWLVVKLWERWVDEY